MDTGFFKPAKTTIQIPFKKRKHTNKSMFIT